MTVVCPGRRAARESYVLLLYGTLAEKNKIKMKVVYS